MTISRASLAEARAAAAATSSGSRPSTTPWPEALRASLRADCERAALGSLAGIDADPQVSSRRVTIRGVRIVERDAALVWELRAGGARLGRARTLGARRSVAIVLTARGRACVVRGRCRASLYLSRPGEPIGGDRITPLPLNLSR